MRIEPAAEAILAGSTVNRLDIHDDEGLQRIDLFVRREVEGGEWDARISIEPDGLKGLSLTMPEGTYRGT